MSSPDQGPAPTPLPATREIWVQKHPDSPDDRVAIWDRDDAHPPSRGNPRGELYIADRFPRLVAETPAVQQKLQRTQGGAPDLRTLREDEAKEITDKMDKEDEERRAVAEEDALASQANAPGQSMPPDVSAYLANAGLVAMPASALSAQPVQTAAPRHTATATPAASSHDTTATHEDDDEEAGGGRKPRGGR